MTRITDKDLLAVVKRLNILTNSPLDPYTREGGKFTANIGCYHLSYAYGGVTLYRMDNDGGGVNTPLGGGYHTKRELYNLMQAFINGIESKREV